MSSSEEEIRKDTEMRDVAVLVLCYGVTLLAFPGFFLIDRAFRRHESRAVLREAGEVSRYAALLSDDSTEK